MTENNILYLRDNDRNHVNRILKGDERAFNELVNKHYNTVYSLAYRMLNNTDDAKETAQDTFVKIYHTLSNFRGEASVKTWIMRITLRLSLNKRRDRSRSAWERLGLHQNKQPKSLFSHLQSPEAKLISDEVSSQVRELIDALPEEMRQVMILNSFENLSYDEIGQILRIPIGTVSSRLYSARKLLSAQLKETNIL
jgi:RNA polymerase sigma-70 factor (ECF subfamily)